MIDTSFRLVNAQGHAYTRIEGDGTDLRMTETHDVVNVGGLPVESNPTYTIQGTCKSLAVKLLVKPEDQVAQVGGLKVQTGTVYHVNGAAGAMAVQGDITRRDSVTKSAGLNVETDAWKVFTPQGGGQPVLRVGSVSQFEDAGGIKVEAGRWDVVGGRDAQGSVQARLDGYDGENAFQVAGTMAPETMALVVALQPFLKV